MTQATMMGWGRFWLKAGLASLLFPALACAQQAFDLDGHAVNPFEASAGKVTVLVFVRRDCPISGRYAPVIQQISRQYAHYARFWLVYPDKNETADSIRKSLAEFGYRLPVLRDPGHALVKLGHVQITPEVAVFDQNRQLIYDGRIDDWFIDFARARPAATRHELREAIRAALAHEPIAPNEVRGVGCYISDVE